ncbi:hypothetical protein ABTP31_19735, partial [Acinetobacter baumannii]
SVKVKNVIGIDTAKDDKFACSFHHFCSRESAPPDPGGACPAFLFLYCPSDRCQSESHITA